MISRVKKDRRKINVTVPSDRRGSKMDRRRCPRCDRTVMGRIRSVRGGTVQFSRCGYCGWEGKKSRQIDEGLAEVLLSFDGRISKAGKRLWMELDGAIMKSAGYAGRKRLHFKAVVVGGRAPKIRWIVE